MKKTILALGLMVMFTSCGTLVNEDSATTATDSTIVITDSTLVDTTAIAIDSVEVVK